MFFKFWQCLDTYNLCVLLLSSKYSQSSWRCFVSYSILIFISQNLCRALGAEKGAAATQLCVCSDDVSDPATFWDITPATLSQLSCWWERRMVSGSAEKTPLNNDLYVDIVARWEHPYMYATQVLKVKHLCTVCTRTHTHTHMCTLAACGPSFLHHDADHGWVTVDAESKVPITKNPELFSSGINIYYSSDYLLCRVTKSAY